MQAQVQGSSSSSSYTRALAHPHRHPHVNRVGRLFLAAAPSRGRSEIQALRTAASRNHICWGSTG